MNIVGHFLMKKPESLKFSFCVIDFPFTVSYDTRTFFFVNFVVSTALHTAGAAEI